MIPLCRLCGKKLIFLKLNNNGFKEYKKCKCINLKTK